MSKTKAERKARRKKIIDGAKKAVKKVAKVAGTAAVTAPLLPFAPMMNAAIKKAGATPKKNMLDKAKQFHSLIIKKEKFESENIVDDIVDIVKSIVGFFKNKKDRLAAKEEAGEPLTEAEKNTLTAVEAVEEGVKSAATDQVEENIGEKVMEYAKNPIVLLGIAAVVYFGFIKK